jgi:Arc/MetJ-type ribon-helix-helix transcriptional regulator
MKYQKVTFSLPVELLASIREMVVHRQVESASLFVRQSIEAHLREIRETQLTAEFSAAAQDPDFLHDIARTMNDFAALDAETANMICD